MSCISGIIAFQTKKLNLERNLHKETGTKQMPVVSRPDGSDLTINTRIQPVHINPTV